MGTALLIFNPQETQGSLTSVPAELRPKFRAEILYIVLALGAGLTAFLSALLYCCGGGARPLKTIATLSGMSAVIFLAGSIAAAVLLGMVGNWSSSTVQAYYCCPPNATALTPAACLSRKHGYGKHFCTRTAWKNARYPYYPFKSKRRDCTGAVALPPFAKAEPQTCRSYNGIQYVPVATTTPTNDPMMGSGFIWAEQTTKPATGVEIVSPGLASALARKTATDGTTPWTGKSKVGIIKLTSEEKSAIEKSEGWQSVWWPARRWYSNGTDTTGSYIRVGSKYYVPGDSAQEFADKFEHTYGTLAMRDTKRFLLAFGGGELAFLVLALIVTTCAAVFTWKESKEYMHQAPPGHKDVPLDGGFQQYGDTPNYPSEAPVMIQRPYPEERVQYDMYGQIPAAYPPEAMQWQHEDYPQVQYEQYPQMQYEQYPQMQYEQYPQWQYEEYQPEYPPEYQPQYQPQYQQPHPPMWG